MNSIYIKKNKTLLKSRENTTELFCALPLEIQFWKVLDDESVIVLTKTDPSTIASANIFCVSKKGSLLWQIDPPQEKPDPYYPKNAYSNFGFEGEMFVAYATFGDTYEVDLKTGKTKYLRYDK